MFQGMMNGHFSAGGFSLLSCAESVSPAGSGSRNRIRKWARIPNMLGKDAHASASAVVQTASPTRAILV